MTLTIFSALMACLVLYGIQSKMWTHSKTSFAVSIFTLLCSLLFSFISISSILIIIFVFNVGIFIRAIFRPKIQSNNFFKKLLYA